MGLCRYQKKSKVVRLKNVNKPVSFKKTIKRRLREETLECDRRDRALQALTDSMADEYAAERLDPSTPEKMRELFSAKAQWYGV